MDEETLDRGLDDGLSPGRERFMDVPELASLHLELVSSGGKRAGHATGFVMRDKTGQPYLITNRHVFTARNSKDDDKVRSGGIAPSVVVLPIMPADHRSPWVPLVCRLGDDDGRPLWREHPTYGKRFDVVALPLDLDESRIDLVTMPRVAPLAYLDLTSELFVVGFPIGFDPVLSGAGPVGVWARGTIAWRPTWDWEGLPSFLLDCRARPGQSGSPVVFQADEFTSFRGADGTIKKGPAWEFVGVYSGRTHEHSDIGIVWKRAAVIELIDQGVQPTVDDYWVPEFPAVFHPAGLQLPTDDT
ncbi:S1 family peptidase [Streptomyces sp. NRRL F-5122]|uniref:S1 family peptidase n=1 Tax=Streptomyces sp. NRRL F-5122 TaxID=1609098 RepID=UPI00099EDBD0|nr:serine protease [Streptomyces sp. NRRL F-5122]